MRWLVMLVNMPPTPSRNRVRVWRRLKRIGAVSLKGAAWVVPENGETGELLQWLMQEIETLKGHALLMRVDRIEPLDDTQLTALFRRERAEEYGKAAKVGQALLKTLSRGSGWRRPEIARVTADLAGLKRELDAIEKIDYLSAPEGAEARTLYDKAAARLALLEDGATMPTLKTKHAMPKPRSVWVTRPRPHVDRIGSAWLIARFYDPKARFAFAEDPKTVKNGIPFDVLGAEFGHHGEDSTFETLLKRLGLKDRKFRAIAEIVHEIDLQDGKYSRPESAGIDLALKGLAANHADDHALLKAGMVFFDGLYSTLKA
jgi:hypothetical protein